ncbi:MAG TPA: crosslink repair DNA glycosylase YcaQ family protein [Candidatus Limnocylindrales bacterium]|nr:crosslink repair DNA glycosylase YcaQ family protein [Candidatus Limnocylindrales bacterium]
MTLDDRVRAWSYRRQQLGRTGTDDLLATLANTVAAYASQPTAILALAARAPRIGPDAFRALEADRAAVRIPAMRGSSHLVPTETAATVFAATRRPADQLSWLWRGIGLSADEYAHARDAVVDAAGDVPVSVVDLRRLVRGEAATLLERHPQAPTFVVRAARTEGLLIAIGPEGLRSNAFTYVATATWLKRPFEPVDPDEALGWLVGEYLRAFGPARAEDIRWWTGATAQRAKRALARHATVDVGDGLLLPAHDAEAFAATDPLDPDAIELTPLWDMWTMGYARGGRSRFVRPEDESRLFANNADGMGAVLRGGRAIGAWWLRFRGARMEVDLDLFVPASTALRSVVDDRLGEVALLLGAAGVDVVDGPVRGRRLA